MRSRRAYDDARRQDPAIRQHARLSSKTHRYYRAPVVCDDNNLAIILEELLPHLQDELRHNFQNGAGIVLIQACAATVSREVDSNECAAIARAVETGKNVTPEEAGVGEAWTALASAEESKQKSCSEPYHE